MVPEPLQARRSAPPTVALPVAPGQACAVGSAAWLLVPDELLELVETVRPTIPVKRASAAVVMSVEVV